ncbi:hypothetical protein, partial [Klebsiella pneumoniae]|uniref:hypothetical protein n=1 Tax=Klebsiella pneumoniae TaxID=573 RepID=UPI0040558015
MELNKFLNALYFLGSPESKYRLKHSLQLFIDDQGILRVGGRLVDSSLSYCSRHPILLPKNHPFTDLIVDHAHIAN